MLLAEIKNRNKVLCMTSEAKKIGTIISGALSEGLTMRLASNCPLETIKTGKFVSVVGNVYRYFSLVTDL